MSKSITLSKTKRYSTRRIILAVVLLFVAGGTVAGYSTIHRYYSDSAKIRRVTDAYARAIAKCDTSQVKKYYPSLKVDRQFTEVFNNNCTAGANRLTFGKVIKISKDHSVMDYKYSGADGVKGDTLILLSKDSQSHAWQIINLLSALPTQTLQANPWLSGIYVNNSREFTLPIENGRIMEPAQLFYPRSDKFTLGYRVSYIIDIKDSGARSLGIDVSDMVMLSKLIDEGKIGEASDCINTATLIVDFTGKQRTQYANLKDQKRLSDGRWIYIEPVKNSCPVSQREFIDYLLSAESV